MRLDHICGGPIYCVLCVGSSQSFTMPLKVHCTNGSRKMWHTGYGQLDIQVSVNFYIAFTHVINYIFSSHVSALSNASIRQAIYVECPVLYVTVSERLHVISMRCECDRCRTCQKQFCQLVN